MRRLAEARLAAMVLTRFPVGRIDGEPPQLASTIWAFPVVGAAIGALMWGVYALALWIGLPPLGAALLAVACAAMFTGGLHEDGLADTADGFGGGQTRERKLEIMKDSRIGSFGVLALIFVTGLTASAIAETGELLAFMTISAASRTAILMPMIFLRPARTGGLGHGARARADKIALVAFGLTLGLAIGTSQLVALFVMAVVALWLTGLSARQIGGQTGDTLGATQKLTECAGWLTVAAMST